MNLKILLPYQVLLEKKDVQRIVAETGNGSFGILPHRLDCVAALVPGILVFEASGEGETYIAIDEGSLVKTGQDVRISVRNAYVGTDLTHLQDVVEHQFVELDEQEKNVRSVMAKMENGFIRRLIEVHNA